MAQARVVRTIAGVAIAALALTGLTGCDGPTVARGRITAAGTGAHPAGMTVTAYSNDAESVVDEVLTDADGTYRFGVDALPAGTYRLRFNHDVWWGGTSWSSATPVTVSTETPLALSPTISYRPATISGTVTGGGPVILDAHNRTAGPLLSIELEDQDLEAPGYQYTVELPAGSYRPRFRSISTEAMNETRFVYAGGAYTAYTAPTFDLEPGDRETVDATFPDGWQFSGEVTNGVPAEWFEQRIGTNHLVVSADTLEHVATLGMQYSKDFRAVGIPPIPVRILLIDPSGQLRPTFVGESATDPDGAVFESEAEVPYTLEMIGRDCTKGDFVPGADHTGRDLSGARLDNCDLRHTDLRGFDLSGSVLLAADLTGADLTGADLAYVPFHFADLSHADLTGATITGATGGFQATFSNTTCPNGTVVSSPATCFR